MNLLNIFTLYPDQEACIEHLEAVRWGDEPNCPHCGSLKVGRKSDTFGHGRWNCHDCKSSFNVLSGTIFEKTKINLQKVVHGYWPRSLMPRRAYLAASWPVTWN